jgi:hypothetical protein
VRLAAGADDDGIHFKEAVMATPPIDTGDTRYRREMQSAMALIVFAASGIASAIAALMII